jgi:membrane-associated protein
MAYGSILGVLLSYILLYKYLTIFIATFLAGIIVPIPDSELLMAVGAFAGQGYLNCYLVLAAGLAGNTLGDLVDFFLARRYGTAVLRKFRLEKRKFVGALEAEVRRDAPFMIFATRIAGTLGPAVNIFSGISGISFKKFLFYDITGNLVDIGGLLLIGYTVGSYWESFSDVIGIIVAIAVIIIIIFTLWRTSRRIVMRNSKGKNETAQ